MKILDTSNISPSAQMPIKKGTLQFLQDAYKECIESILKGTIGASYSTSTYYILYGCVNTGVGSNYIISAGAIFFNGEVYLVDGVTFTTGVGQVPVMNITTTQYTTNADPVTFTNSIQYNVHNIRKIVISAGTAAGNVYGVNSNNVFVNFANLSNFTNSIIEQTANASLQTKVLDIGTWDMNSVANVDVAHGLADISKIRSYEILIIDDNQDYVKKFDAYELVTNAGVAAIDSVNVSMVVLGASSFATNAIYSGTSINRGTITIQYEA